MGTVAQTGVGISILGDIQSSAGHDPEQAVPHLKLALSWTRWPSKILSNLNHPMVFLGTLEKNQPQNRTRAVLKLVIKVETQGSLSLCFCEWWTTFSLMGPLLWSHWVLWQSWITDLQWQLTLSCYYGLLLAILCETFIFFHDRFGIFCCLNWLQQVEFTQVKPKVQKQEEWKQHSLVLCREFTKCYWKSSISTIFGELLSTVINDLPQFSRWLFHLLCEII